MTMLALLVLGYAAGRIAGYAAGHIAGHIAGYAAAIHARQAPTFPVFVRESEPAERITWPERERRRKKPTAKIEVAR